MVTPALSCSACNCFFPSQEAYMIHINSMSHSKNTADKERLAELDSPTETQKRAAAGKRKMTEWSGGGSPSKKPMFSGREAFKCSLCRTISKTKQAYEFHVGGILHRLKCEAAAKDKTFKDEASQQSKILSTTEKDSSILGARNESSKQQEQRDSKATALPDGPLQEENGNFLVSSSGLCKKQLHDSNGSVGLDRNNSQQTQQNSYVSVSFDEAKKCQAHKDRSASVLSDVHREKQAQEKRKVSVPSVELQQEPQEVNTFLISSDKPSKQQAKDGCNVLKGFHEQCIEQDGNASLQPDVPYNQQAKQSNQLGKVAGLPVAQSDTQKQQLSHESDVSGYLVGATKPQIPGSIGRSIDSSESLVQAEQPKASGFRCPVIGTSVAQDQPQEQKSCCRSNVSVKTAKLDKPQAKSGEQVKKQTSLDKTALENCMNDYIRGNISDKVVKKVALENCINNEIREKISDKVEYRTALENCIDDDIRGNISNKVVLQSIPGWQESILAKNYSETMLFTQTAQQSKICAKSHGEMGTAANKMKNGANQNKPVEKLSETTSRVDHNISALTPQNMVSQSGEEGKLRKGWKRKMKKDQTTVSSDSSLLLACNQGKNQANTVDQHKEMVVDNTVEQQSLVLKNEPQAQPIPYEGCLEGNARVLSSESIQQVKPLASSIEFSTSSYDERDSFLNNSPNPKALLERIQGETSMVGTVDQDAPSVGLMVHSPRSHNSAECPSQTTSHISQCLSPMDTRTTVSNENFTRIESQSGQIIHDTYDKGRQIASHFSQSVLSRSVISSAESFQDSVSQHCQRMYSASVSVGHMFTPSLISDSMPVIKVEPRSTTPIQTFRYFHNKNKLKSIQDGTTTGKFSAELPICESACENRDYAFSQGNFMVVQPESEIQSTAVQEQQGKIIVMQPQAETQSSAIQQQQIIITRTQPEGEIQSPAVQQQEGKFIVVQPENDNHILVQPENDNQPPAIHPISAPFCEIKPQYPTALLLVPTSKQDLLQASGGSQPKIQNTLNAQGTTLPLGQGQLHVSADASEMIIPKLEPVSPPAQEHSYVSTTIPLPSEQRVPSKGDTACPTLLKLLTAGQHKSSSSQMGRSAKRYKLSTSRLGQSAKRHQHLTSRLGQSTESDGREAASADNLSSFAQSGYTPRRPCATEVPEHPMTALSAPAKEGNSGGDICKMLNQPLPQDMNNNVIKKKTKHTEPQLHIRIEKMPHESEILHCRDNEEDLKLNTNTQDQGEAVAYHVTDVAIGDRVFAKMKGYPPWPARVEKLLDSSKQLYKVFFYGTHDFGHIKLKNLYPYEEYEVKFGICSRKHFRWGFKEGLYEIKNKPDITGKTKARESQKFNRKPLLLRLRKSPSVGEECLKLRRNRKKLGKELGCQLCNCQARIIVKKYGLLQSKARCLEKMVEDQQKKLEEQERKLGEQEKSYQTLRRKHSIVRNTMKHLKERLQHDVATIAALQEDWKEEDVPNDIDLGQDTGNKKAKVQQRRLVLALSTIAEWRAEWLDMKGKDSRGHHEKVEEKMMAGKSAQQDFNKASSGLQHKQKGEEIPVRSPQKHYLRKRWLHTSATCTKKGNHTGVEEIPQLKSSKKDEESEPRIRDDYTQGSRTDMPTTETSLLEDAEMHQSEDSCHGDQVHSTTRCWHNKNLEVKTSKRVYLKDKSRHSQALGLPELFIPLVRFDC